MTQPATLKQVLEFELVLAERQLVRAIRDVRSIMDAAERDLQCNRTRNGVSVSIAGLLHYAAEFERCAASVTAKRETLHQLEGSDR